MRPLRLARYSFTSALGVGLAAQVDGLQAGRSGLTSTPFESCALPCFTGVVAGLDAPLSADWQLWDCRNNRLAEIALQQDALIDSIAALKAQVGAARIGLFMGTSTAGVHHTEVAYTQRDESGALPVWFNYRTSQNTYSVGEYVRQRLGLTGPSLVISTACSSSAKVFASAARAIAVGLCDAAVVGGVDSLCQTTLYGFNALQLISPEVCKPGDAARRGISIGEAAGFAVLVPADGTPGIHLLGYGESSDAHHMSAPEPSGRGAFAAMQQALQRGATDAADVSFVHLHGTATPANDAAEDQAVTRLLGTTVPVASTKGSFGHSLGAAGALGALVAAVAIDQQFTPGAVTTQNPDPALRAALQLAPRPAKVRRVLSNAFGFGGSNCSLLLGSL